MFTKTGEIQDQTRQQSQLINLLGVKQIRIGVNKMDCDVAGNKKKCYDGSETNECEDFLKMVTEAP